MVSKEKNSAGSIYTHQTSNPKKIYIWNNTQTAITIGGKMNSKSGSINLKLETTKGFKTILRGSIPCSSLIETGQGIMVRRVLCSIALTSLVNTKICSDAQRTTI